MLLHGDLEKETKAKVVFKHLNLKGTVSRDFLLQVFYESSSSSSLIIQVAHSFEVFRKFSKKLLCSYVQNSKSEPKKLSFLCTFSYLGNYFEENEVEHPTATCDHLQYSCKGSRSNYSMTTFGIFLYIFPRVGARQN